jgi:hypothetical protein
MKTTIGVLAAVAIGCIGGTAMAEETKKAPQKGVVEVEPVHIKLRPPYPLVATDVARIVPKVKLSELRQPLVDRIAKAVEKDPF